MEYLEGKDIVCNETQRCKKMKTGEDNDTVPVDIPPLHQHNKQCATKKLSECRTQDGKLVKPAILSIIPDFAQNYVPCRVNLDIPLPLTS